MGCFVVRASVTSDTSVVSLKDVIAESVLKETFGLLQAGEAVVIDTVADVVLSNERVRSCFRAK